MHGGRYSRWTARALGFLFLIAFTQTPAGATEGYFSSGYGTVSKGMGGVSTATAQDAMGGASNPASMVWVGNRVDLGLNLFSPRRGAKRSGTNFPSLNGEVKSGKRLFFIPEFGLNKMLTKDLSLGVTVYGNGGLNTRYQQGAFNFGRGPSNILGGQGELGVNMSQLVVAPTVSYRFHKNHSIGVSPLIGYQQFQAYGLQSFAPFSSDPANLTNRGMDYSTGAGVRIGYYGKLHDKFSIGGAWASRMNMSPFDKYRGLFAESGDFDLPENFNLGFAWKPTGKLMLAGDYQRINFSSVNSVGNPSRNTILGKALGTPDGPGFGWTDVNVYKVGVQYQFNPNFTLRAGYNHCDNPVRSSDTTFNIIAPGVIQDHLSLGATIAIDERSSLNLAYIHALNNTVNGPSLFNDVSPVSGGRERLNMYQNTVAGSWSMKW